MAQVKSEDWIKGGLAAVVSLGIAGGVLYLACGRQSDNPAPPAGSVYFKGVMNADIESAAHDPRKHHGAAVK